MGFSDNGWKIDDGFYLLSQKWFYGDLERVCNLLRRGFVNLDVPEMYYLLVYGGTVVLLWFL